MLACHVTTRIIIDYMDVFENRGTPKSSILIGFSIIHHSFWGTTISGNLHINMGVTMNLYFPFFSWFTSHGMLVRLKSWSQFKLSNMVATSNWKQKSMSFLKAFVCKEIGIDMLYREDSCVCSCLVFSSKIPLKPSQSYRSMWVYIDTYIYIEIYIYIFDILHLYVQF